MSRVAAHPGPAWEGERMRGAPGPSIRQRFDAWARGEGYELTGAHVAAAGDHAAAAAAALGTGALVRERIAANVADDGPAARWARQFLGFDAGR